MRKCMQGEIGCHVFRQMNPECAISKVKEQLRKVCEWEIRKSGVPETASEDENKNIHAGLQPHYFCNILERENSNIMYSSKVFSNDLGCIQR